MKKENFKPINMCLCVCFLIFKALFGRNYIEGKKKKRKKRQFLSYMVGKMITWVRVEKVKTFQKIELKKC